MEEPQQLKTVVSCNAHRDEQSAVHRSLQPSSVTQAHCGAARNVSVVPGGRIGNQAVQSIHTHNGVVVKLRISD